MGKRRASRTRAAHVRDLLNASPAVAECLALQRREDGLLTQVRDLLPAPARAHCIQATATDGSLSVTVDAAAWATRLRYLAPDLVRGLAGSGITVVKLRTRPPTQEARRQTPRRLDKLTRAVADHLLTAAEHTVDAGIAEIFRRLATRHQDPDEPFA